MSINFRPQRELLRHELYSIGWGEMEVLKLGDRMGSIIIINNKQRTKNSYELNKLEQQRKIKRRSAGKWGDYADRTWNRIEKTRALTCQQESFVMHFKVWFPLLYSFTVITIQGKGASRLQAWVTAQPFQASIISASFLSPLKLLETQCKLQCMTFSLKLVINPSGGALRMVAQFGRIYDKWIRQTENTRISRNYSSHGYSVNKYC